MSLRAAVLIVAALAGPAGAALVVDEVENFENVPIKAVGGRAL
jgi:ABC-type uncharacterized transport system permease subunit